MEIRFSITKGDPTTDPGDIVPIQTFDIAMHRVGRLMMTDYNKNNLEYINFMFEGGYHLWIVSDSKGPRITLRLPGKR